MTIKDLNEIRSKMYNELIKFEEIKNALKHSEQIYIYDIQEKTKHEIVVFEKITHLNNNWLKEHGFSENAYTKRLYTINRQTKLCY